MPGVREGRPRPDEIAVDLLDHDNVIPEQEDQFVWTFPVEPLTQETEP